MILQTNFGPPPEPCQREGCSFNVHHVCQNMWEENHNWTLQSISRYCPQHHHGYGSGVMSPLRGNKLSQTEPKQSARKRGGYCCDWFDETKCEGVQNINPRKCKSVLNCKKKVHKLCMLTWENRMKLEGKIEMQSLDDSDEEDDDVRDDILCGFCRDHHPHYDDVMRAHRKKPPGEAVQVEVSDVAFESLIASDSEEKAADLEEQEDDGTVDSRSRSDSEDLFDDSDLEGDELTLHNSAVVARKKCAATNRFIDNDTDNIDCGDGEELVKVETIAGCPDGWKPPSAPDSWKGYQPKWGAPDESEIDNPGKWDLFCFCPKYVVGKREYKYHCTPCGAQVVPANEVGLSL